MGNFLKNWVFIVNRYIMKKIRLTEKELTNIIKRVINEGVVQELPVSEFIKLQFKAPLNKEMGSQSSGTWKIENGKFYITDANGKVNVVLK